MKDSNKYLMRDLWGLDYATDRANWTDAEQINVIVWPHQIAVIQKIIVSVDLTFCVFVKNCGFGNYDPVKIMTAVGLPAKFPGFG